MPYSGPSIINPESVLLICIFFAVSAIVGVVLSQSWIIKAGKNVKTDHEMTILEKKNVSESSTHIIDQKEITEVDSLWKKLQEEGASTLLDEEVLMLVDIGKIPSYSLEKTLGDYTRAVKIRRCLICIYILRKFLTLL